jgi:hypothetical protein
VDLRVAVPRSKEYRSVADPYFTRGSGAPVSPSA